MTDYKYLGITYDPHLRWNVHISNIIKKTKYLVYVFYRLKNVISKKQMLQIYYGLFNSIAVYGIIGWGGSYDAALDPLDRLQQRIINIIGVSNQDQPLNIRQIFVVNCIVYLCSELKSQFLAYTVNTRFKSLEIPKHSLTISQRSYKYYGKKYSNTLPMDCKALSVSDKTLKKN